MKKVLILVNHDVVIYNFRKEVVERLLEDGYKVYISSPYGERIDYLTAMGCEHIEVSLERHGTNPINELKVLNYYRKLVKQLKPHVVLSYTIKPNIYGGLSCSLYNIPYIPNITGLGIAIDKGGIIQRIIIMLYKISFRKAHCTFFQNTQNLNFFTDRKIIKDNYRLVAGSGVNLEDYIFEKYPEDNGTMRFLFIGRIMKDKGIEELVKAAIKIKSIYNNIEFEAIGFCEEEYKEKILELQELNVVKFSGVKKSVHENIKKCNAVILPSYHEGMSNVLLESASTGRPIIASNISGCKETFDEGVSGFGFEVKNVDSLVQAIIKFIELPHSKKKEMGIAGRKKMEKEYDRNIVIKAYMEEINNLN